MPPQTFRVAPSYDVWQLGCLACHVVTGHAPFDDTPATLGLLASEMPLPEEAIREVAAKDAGAAALLGRVLLARATDRAPLGGRKGLLASSFFAGGISTVEVAALSATSGAQGGSSGDGDGATNGSGGSSGGAGGGSGGKSDIVEARLAALARAQAEAVRTLRSMNDGLAQLRTQMNATFNLLAQVRNRVL